MPFFKPAQIQHKNYMKQKKFLFAALAAMLLSIVMTGCKETKEESKAMSFDEVLTTRRSVRTF